MDTHGPQMHSFLRIIQVDLKAMSWLIGALAFGFWMSEYTTNE